MRSTYNDRKAVCPFYKREEQQKICCEGIQERSSLHLTFSSPEEQKKYLERFCNSISGYCKCKVAIMLKSKY